MIALFSHHFFIGGFLSLARRWKAVALGATGGAVPAVGAVTRRRDIGGAAAAPARREDARVVGALFCASLFVGAFAGGA
jgi:hypothetical protein